MSSTKISSVVMYIVVGITLVVMLLFYTGKNLVDQKEYDSKVAKIENPTGKSSIPDLMQDLKSADSLAVGADSSALAYEKTPVTENNETVSLTFMEKLVYNQTDIPLFWAYALIAIAVILTVTFPIIFLFKHPANLLKSLIIFVIIAIFVGIAYSVASGTPFDIPGYTGTANSNPGLLRIIDTGLIFTYFMLGISLLSFLYSQIANYFK